MFSFGIKQRGQGRSPLSCIVARRTLHYHRVSTKIPVTQRLNVLLWIISRVCENVWVYTPFNTTNALNNDAISVCMQEVLVKQIACINSLRQ